LFLYRSPIYFYSMLLDKPHLPYLPNRIISLVPSQTELLFDLGLDSKVVGITKFCIHPALWHSNKLNVGGTKKINLAAVHSLKPDLVIANREENTKDEIEIIANDFPVWVTDVKDMTSAIQMIHDIGCLTHSTDIATSLAAKIQISFRKLRPSQAPVKVAYMIWRKPYMVAGGDTFIHHMLQQCGWRNIFANHKRYPVTNIKEIAAKNCEWLLLSSEPYPFNKSHVH